MDTRRLILLFEIGKITKIEFVEQLETKDPVYISYCLRKGYITADQARKLLE